LSQQIEEYISANADSRLAVRVVRQQGIGGTAAALRACREEVARDCALTESLLISATDYAVPRDYFKDLVSCHASHDDPISVSLRPIRGEQAAGSSLALVEGARLVEIREKPSSKGEPPYLAASLIYIVPVSIFDYLNVPVSPRGEQELPDAINMMINAGVTARCCPQQELPTLAVTDLTT
jgi:NDP-sugar pyrophosphorylase family protein